MMKIVFYTSGVSGSGRLVLGLSIYNAFKRYDIPCEFTILHSANSSRILNQVNHYKLPMESAAQTDAKHFPESAVYKKLVELSPDILIVDLLWIPLTHILSQLPCKKLFLTRQVSDAFFSWSFNGVHLTFNPAQYERVIAIEPYPCPVTDEFINPIVIRNHNEILPAETAQQSLCIDPKKQHCLFSLNIQDSDSQDIYNSYAYLEEEGYDIFRSSLFSGGIFPIADYFNAFDLVIGGAGYNAFWETRFFNKDSIYIPAPKQFENQQWRIDNCQDYKFKRNGADELLEIITNL